MNYVLSEQKLNHNVRERTYRYLHKTKALITYSPIKVYMVRMKKLCISGYQNWPQWRFWANCANAQADLNRRLAHITEGMFSDVAAQTVCVGNDV